jgi:hypothetical protein
VAQRLAHAFPFATLLLQLWLKMPFSQWKAILVDMGREEDWESPTPPSHLYEEFGCRTTLQESDSPWGAKLGSISMIMREERQ